MINVLRNGKHLPQLHCLSCVCACVCGRLDARAHILYPYMCSLLFVRVCVWCVFLHVYCVHFSQTLGVTLCVCVCVHCADWAGVLAIRKTTSGKVHINHVPQLKERNGAEMGRGREGGGERIMRDGVWGIQSRSVALFALTWCWKHLWIGKVTTMGPNPLGRENQTWQTNKCCRQSCQRLCNLLVHLDWTTVTHCVLELVISS